MTRTNQTKKSAELRGTKVMLAALSVAATVTGWAWLTTQQTAFGSTDIDIVNAAETFEVNQVFTLTRDRQGTIWFQEHPARTIPNLAQLPVRGLRVARDGATAPGALSVGQARDRSGNGQISGSQQARSGSTVSPAAQNPQPQQNAPQPKARRKTRSSR